MMNTARFTLILFCLLAIGYISADTVTAQSREHNHLQNHAVLQQTCHSENGLPDPLCSPGDVLNATKEQICVRGYAKTARNVPSSVKKAVYKEYGITSHKPGEFEIDHILSLELSGSNDIKNLWPEPYDLNINGFQMGAHEKDKAENAVHAAICDGRVSLEEVQQNFPKDWTVYYRRFVSSQFPVYEGVSP